MNRLTRLVEAGIVDYWFTNAQTNTSECLRHPKTDRITTEKKLNLEAFYGPFAFYFSGEIPLINFF